MNRKIALIAIPVLALGACTQRGYEAEPVVSADDQRATEVPDLGDEDAIKEQDCFRISIYAYGFNDHEENVGIACIVGEVDEDES